MRTRNGIITLLALWILLIAPATCGGGLLPHPCAEDNGAACEHEADCADDPCNIAQDVAPVANTGVNNPTVAVALVPVVSTGHTAAASDAPRLHGMHVPAAPLSAYSPLRC